MLGTSDQLVARLSKLKLKKYTANSFKEHWIYAEDVDKSRRKRILDKTIIEVYEVWNERLILRLFYLEQGYQNLEIYREVREITRFIAGSKIKLVRGIGAGLSGTQPYTFNSWRYDETWNNTKLFKYILTTPYYYYKPYHWVRHNDYAPLLKETIHKYSAAELLFKANRRYEPDELFEYLYKYSKAPIVEVITKMKLSHLLEEAHLLRNRFDNLPDILGVKKQDFKYLKAGMSLKFVREHVSTLNKLSENEYELLWNIHLRPHHYATNEVDYSDLRVIRYLAKEDKDPLVYKDYLRFAKKLGYQLEKSSVRFPENLLEEHDLADKKLATIQSAETKQLFLDRFEENRDLMFNDKTFIIMPVKEQSELIKESETLQHCVRHYSDKVAKGETNILFVRDLEHKDKPLVTVELKNNIVIQARAKKNTVPDLNIRKFISEWAKENKIDYEFNQ